MYYFEPNFCVGGDKLLDKDEKIRITGKKSNRMIIRGDIGLYQFCAYHFFALVYFILTILTLIFFLQILGIYYTRVTEFRKIFFLRF